MTPAALEVLCDAAREGRLPQRTEKK